MQSFSEMVACYRDIINLFGMVFHRHLHFLKFDMLSRCLFPHIFVNEHNMNKFRYCKAVFIDKILKTIFRKI